MRKADIQTGKADFHESKPDIDTASDLKKDPEKKSVLKDLEAKKPQNREAKTSRKSKKQKEEMR